MVLTGMSSVLFGGLAGVMVLTSMSSVLFSGLSGVIVLVTVSVPVSIFLFGALLHAELAGRVSRRARRVAGRGAH